jgi:hypothetical protein
VHVEPVPAFLDEMARRVVPACDPAVVQAVFARASAGYAGPRGRDGQRVSIITPSGVPFEASVTAGAGRPSAALRYVTETATAMPFFGPRLAAQRAALDDLIGWLPAPGQAAADQLRAAVDVFFPDPPLVPARTRFAITFGIVHRAEVPAGIAALKVYGNLGPDGASLGRLAERWPAFGPLGDPVVDLAFLSPHFATVEVDAAGRLGHKLYLRTRRANAAALAVLARRFDADVGHLRTLLAEAGVGDAAWQRPIFVCCEPGSGAGDDGPEMSVHLPGKALGLDPGAMAELAARLVAEGDGDGDDGDEGGGGGSGGGGGGRRALAAVRAAAGRAGGTWVTTVLGVGLRRGGGLGKVNVYVAPVAAPAGPPTASATSPAATGDGTGPVTAASAGRGHV